MISVANRWQSEIRKPADGTQPVNNGFGTAITASGFAHTMGSWTDIVAAADWSGFTGDAFLIEINLNRANAGGANKRVLVDIGIDTGSGYTALITYLIAHSAADFAGGANGYNYTFPIRIPNGAKVGARCQGSSGSQVVYACVNLFGNPSHPALVRAGTFSRTFGANAASTSGTAFTGGTVSEGAWTSVATTADDLWFWDVGYGNEDAALNYDGYVLDLGVGAAASEVAFLRNAVFSLHSDELVGKLSTGIVYPIASGGAISVRGQTQNTETGDHAIVYAIGGSHALATPYTVAGTVTINGAAAPNGEDVLIYAVDADGIPELVATVTTSGGTGAFTASVPDNTRDYFAKYDDGTYRGVSALDTPV